MCYAVHRHMAARGRRRSGQITTRSSAPRVADVLADLGEGEGIVGFGAFPGIEQPAGILVVEDRLAGLAEAVSVARTQPFPRNTACSRTINPVFGQSVVHDHRFRESVAAGRAVKLSARFGDASIRLLPSAARLAQLGARAMPGNPVLPLLL
jgi:hypothetical protein